MPYAKTHLSTHHPEKNCFTTVFFLRIGQISAVWVHMHFWRSIEYTYFFTTLRHWKQTTHTTKTILKQSRIQNNDTCSSKLGSYFTVGKAGCARDSVFSASVQKIKAWHKWAWKGTINTTYVSLYSSSFCTLHTTIHATITTNLVDTVYSQSLLCCSHGSLGDRARSSHSPRHDCQQSCDQCVLFVMHR